MSSSSLFSNSVYVDLKYNEIYLTFTAGSVRLCGVCEVMSSSLVVLVPYMDEEFAVTVVRLLLFELHLCMLRRCEGYGNAFVRDGGGVVVVSAGMNMCVVHVV